MPMHFPRGAGDRATPELDLLEESGVQACLDYKTLAKDRDCSVHPPMSSKSDQKLGVVECDQSAAVNDQNTIDREGRNPQFPYPHRGSEMDNLGEFDPQPRVDGPECS